MNAGSDLGADAALLPALLHPSPPRPAVFLTDAMMVSVSIGRSVRRSITSASMPSFASFIGGLDRVAHAVRPGDDGDVVAGADDARALPSGIT